jgi:hypothetical protein
MTFGQIPAGATVFLDANSLVYHFTNDPKYGAASTRLVQRIEHRILSGFTSSDVMGDVAHRLMTLFQGLSPLAIEGRPFGAHDGGDSGGPRPGAGARPTLRSRLKPGVSAS